MKDFSLRLSKMNAIIVQFHRLTMTFLSSHARAIYTRDSGKNTGRNYAFSARNALEALAIIDKCRAIKSSSEF